MQGFLRAGPSCTPSPSGQGNGVTLEAVRHEGGHRAPEVVAIVPVEDKISLSHTARLPEELSCGWSSPLLVEVKACAMRAPLPGLPDDSSLLSKCPQQPHVCKWRFLCPATSHCLF